MTLPPDKLDELKRAAISDGEMESLTTIRPNDLLVLIATARRAEKMEEALEPFAKAYKRLRRFSEVNPAEQSPLYANSDPLYELLDGSKPLTMANLKTAVAALPKSFKRK